MAVARICGFAAWQSWRRRFTPISVQGAHQDPFEFSFTGDRRLVGEDKLRMKHATAATFRIIFDRRDFPEAGLQVLLDLSEEEAGSKDLSEGRVAERLYLVSLLLSLCEVVRGPLNEATSGEQFIEAGDTGV